VNVSAGAGDKGPMSKTPKKSGAPRVLSPERTQLEWQVVDVDDLVPEDHRVRVVWAAVERLDLSAFYDAIAARGHRPGRPAHDPRLLLALWLYATSEGVGSARQLERLCERDYPYRWLCGGVKPNHHSLSDFRVGHGDKLDDLMTQLLAALMKEKLVKLKRVAQDGVRVRASAGAASFRRGETLQRLLGEAKAQVEALRGELDEEPAASSAREKAARERAANDRLARVQKAIKQLPGIAEVQARNAKRHGQKRESKSAKTPNKGPRASTTDPEARVMKMADGGFRPAVNVQFSTDVDSRVVVGTSVTNDGADATLLEPMLDQLKRRTGRLPKEVLVDGGYTSLGSITGVEKRGVAVYAPVPRPRTDGIDPYARKAKDTDESARWRARMKTDAAKTIYKQRGATAELVNADLRCWRGMTKMPCRGLVKSRAVALMLALTHNILRAHVLRKAA
jgi:transposase